VSASETQQAQGASNRRNTHLKPHWVKGQSGNPKGRPPADQDVAALCRIHTPECVETLVKAMRTSPRDAVPAAIALLDRGWGRPKQQLEVSADADAIGMHLTAARAAIVAALADAAGATPATIEHQADGEPIANALDAPKPSE
jgi:hypothetical protein